MGINASKWVGSSILRSVVARGEKYNVYFFAYYFKSASHGVIVCRQINHEFDTHLVIYTFWSVLIFWSAPHLVQWLTNH